MLSLILHNILHSTFKTVKKKLSEGYNIMLTDNGGNAEIEQFCILARSQGKKSRACAALIQQVVYLNCLVCESIFSKFCHLLLS